MKEISRLVKYSALASAACAPAAQADLTIFFPNVTFNPEEQFLFLDVNGGTTSVQDFDFALGPDPAPGAELLFFGNPEPELPSENKSLIAITGVYFGGNADSLILVEPTEDDLPIGKAFKNSERVGETKNFDIAPAGTVSPNGQPNNEGILGFAFLTEDTEETALGWARFTGLGTDSTTLTQVGWNSVDSGNPDFPHVTAIPEVSSNLTLLLLVGGSITTFRQRRKTA